MKFLIMTAAFGTGHNQVANALAEAVSVLGHTADVVDALAVGSPLVSKCLTGGFIQILNKAPVIYRVAYDRTELPGHLDGLKRISVGTLTKLIWPRLKELLAHTQPDVVVGTHPFVLGVLANLRRTGRLRCRLAGVLTDFAPHGMWLHAGVDMYYVATPNMALTMARQGLDARFVHVTGIPIRGVFTQTTERAAAALELGLDPAKPTVLMMGGGLGLGPMREMVAAAHNAGLPLQILAVAGHNRRLYAQLEPLTRPVAGNPAAVHLYGYVPYVHRLMAVSDLLVSKPGAITASEALALALPMLLMEPIPGHEERNQAALVASGAARAVGSPTELTTALRELFADPAALEAMRRAAQRTAEPSAAQLVVQHLSGLMPDSAAWPA